MTEANPTVTLKAQAEEFNFSKLRAGKSNIGANSGEQTYKDINRMSFVINGKEIDRKFIIALKEGAKDYKSELFSRNDVYNLESGEEREIDTDQGRAFVDSVFKKLNQNRLSEIWERHYNDPGTADHQKTDLYKKEFERFYNTGKEYNYLLLKKGDKNYRSFAKEVFKEMFKYAGAEVPSDSILEELVTNCNQAGYVGSLLGDESKPLTKVGFEHGLSFQSIDYTVHINCNNTSRTTIEIKEPISVRTIENPQEEMCCMDSSLEFTLESQDGKDGVTYRDGNLSLTVPKELKNYQEGEKSLFDIIKEYFQKFCEKLGFKFEAKIEQDLGEELEVDSYLKDLKSSVHSNRDVGSHTRQVKKL